MIRYGFLKGILLALFASSFTSICYGADLLLSGGTTTTITSSITYDNATIENAGTILDIDNNATVTINGNFMVRTSAIVYVRDGATLIVNGTDTIQRATMEIFGTFRAENSGTEVGSGWVGQPISHLIIHPTGSVFLLDLKIDSGGDNGAGPPAEVDVYGNLTITQNLEVSAAGDQAELNVYSTGNVTVGGDLINGGDEPDGTSPTDENAQILIDGGVLQVLGDAYNHRQVIIDNDGQFIIGGNYENIPDPDNQGNLYTEVGGTLSVGGTITNNGTLQSNATECSDTGSGTIEWGESIGGTGDVEDTNGTTSVTSGSPGSYDLCSGTLPVTLLYFSAQSVEDRVYLEWQTATEIFNDYFTIERSPDAKNWEVVAVQEGAGTSDVLLNYSHWDHNPYYGTSYYRLIQTDFDGSRTIYSGKSVQLTPTASDFQLYPNPASTRLHISNRILKNMSLHLINSSGAKVPVVVTPGDGHSTLDFSSLPKGIYFLKLNREDFSFSEKIIVN